MQSGGPGNPVSRCSREYVARTPLTILRGPQKGKTQKENAAFVGFNSPAYYQVWTCHMAEKTDIRMIRPPRYIVSFRSRDRVVFSVL